MHIHWLVGEHTVVGAAPVAADLGMIDFELGRAAACSCTA